MWPAPNGLLPQTEHFDWIFLNSVWSAFCLVVRRLFYNDSDRSVSQEGAARLKPGKSMWRQKVFLFQTSQSVFRYTKKKIRTTLSHCWSLSVISEYEVGSVICSLFYYSRIFFEFFFLLIIINLLKLLIWLHSSLKTTTEPHQGSLRTFFHAALEDFMPARIHNIYQQLEKGHTGLFLKHSSDEAFWSNPAWLSGSSQTLHTCCVTASIVCLPTWEWSFPEGKNLKPEEI